MLKSLTTIQADADSFIRAWHAWRESALRVFVGSAASDRRLHEIRPCREKAAHYFSQAQALMSSVDFATLHPDVQADVTAIAEEMQLAVAEIDLEAQADAVWQKLDHAKKRDVTQCVTLDAAEIAKVRARIRGELRGQPIAPRLRVVK